MESIPPTAAAFRAVWPGADVAHLLDGSLYLDRSAGSADEAELAARIDRLIRHSAATGARGILFTGSFFGAAVRAARARVDVPVLASFDGLTERALGLGRPLRVLSTAPDSSTLLVAELRREADAAGRVVDVSGGVVEGAIEALNDGDLERHDALVIDAVDALAAEQPGAVVVLAQFTMERVLDRCRAGSVIGPAGEGVRRLRQLVAG